MSEERNEWVEELERRKQSAYDEAAQSPSFLAEFPASLTAEEFVDGLGARLGRILEQEEREPLVALLKASAMTRASVLRQIAERQG